ncbi:MAG TPA: ribbon-helix-helix domain-containing protein [Hyphomicrobiaceae bacterium]
MDLESLSLTDAIKAVATGHVRTRNKAASPPEPSLTQAMKEVAGRRRKPPTTRAGRKGIVIYVDQEVAAAVRHLAAELNTTVQALGTTAFDLLLEKFGEPRPG